MENTELTFGKKLKKALFSNWIIKIVSILFALLLWAFVLTNLNPIREKTLSSISASFDGEADLIARGLVLRGDYEDIMSNVTVRIDTELIKYADLSKEDLTCTVSLRNVNVMGEYDLRIEAVTTNGTVVGVSPSTIHVEIDKFSTRKIPVEVSGQGSVPNDYYMGEPELSKTEIEIKGPNTDVIKVSRAIASVDLSGRTSGFSESIALTLVDSAGMQIEGSSLYGEIPSVTVSVEILPQKEVEFDVMGALIGLDSLPADQEIFTAYTVPKTVTIIGEKEYLDAIDKIEIESIDITNVKDETVVKDAHIYLPAGVRMVEEMETVRTFVAIREKIIEKQFIAIAISVENIPRSLTHSILPDTVNFVIRGRISVVNQIERQDVQLYLDLSGLDAGTYTMPIEFRLLRLGKQDVAELICTLSEPQVQVTLR